MTLREIYNRPEADFVSRFPSILFGSSNEDLYRYFNWMTSITINEESSIVAMDVQAFRPEDAKAIATVLLAAAEQKINEINARLQVDAVSFAERQLQEKEEALLTAQSALTNFRNQEMVIDPSHSSLIFNQVAAQLSQQLAETETKIGVAKANSP